MWRLFVLVLACSPPPTHRPVSRAVETLPDTPFANLDHDQRAALMKTHVMPAMTPLFQRHDAKFQAVDCKTCHADGSWAMPNPELAVLDLEDLSAHEPADVEWMKTEIVPAMRTILRDPTLRCDRCHPVARP
jgi:hypothetical protein